MDKTGKQDPATVLSPEVFQTMLSWVDAKTLEQTRCVCKNWQQQASDDAVWRNLVKWNFGENAVSIAKNGSKKGKADPKQESERTRYIHLHQAIFGVKSQKNALDKQLVAAAKHNCVRTVNRLLRRHSTFGIVHKLDALRQASKAGNLDVLKELIGSEIDPTSLLNPRKGWPPLFLAVKEGHIETVEYLIKHGANVNWIWRRRTALSHAVQYRDDQVGDKLIGVLLDHKADVNRGDIAPPLHLVCKSKSKNKERLVRIATLLISSGAEVNQVADNKIPLSWAIQVNNTSLIQLLLDKGAQVTEQSRRTLQREGASAAWQLVKQKTQDLPPLIHQAVKNNATERIEALLSSGCKLTDCDGEGESAIGKALSDDDQWCLLSPEQMFCPTVSYTTHNESSQNSYPLLNKDSVNYYRCLSQFGADFNQRGSGGKTAFYHFVAKLCELGNRNRLRVDSKAWAQAIQLFQELGAELLVADNQRVTPLHLCARALDGNLLKQLLPYCDKNHLNVWDSNGRTPLHWATAGCIVTQGTNSSVRYWLWDNTVQLVQAGVDVTIADNHGDTPLHTLLRHVRFEEVSTLQERQLINTMLNALLRRAGEGARQELLLDALNHTFPIDEAGFFLFFGINGLPRQTKQGLKYLELAAGQGSAFAQGQLGRIVFYGVSGVQPNTKRGLELLWNGARGNDAQAQAQLGWILCWGLRGVKGSMQQGRDFLLASAKQGNSFAQSALQMITDFKGVGSWPSLQRCSTQPSASAAAERCPTEAVSSRAAVGVPQATNRHLATAVVPSTSASTGTSTPQHASDRSPSEDAHADEFRGLSTEPSSPSFNQPSNPSKRERPQEESPEQEPGRSPKRPKK